MPKYIPKLKKLPTQPDHKFCTKCGHEKSFAEFKANPKVKIGYSAWCKSCTKEYGRSVYLKNTEGRLSKRLKKCDTCLIVYPKNAKFFYKDKSLKSGFRGKCKKCTSEYTTKRNGLPHVKIENQKRLKEYRATEHAKVMRRIYRDKNRKSFRKSQRTERYKKSQRERKRKRRAEDPVFRLAENLRNAVSKCIRLKGLKKNERFNQYLGCTPIELKAHLESLFQPGMTWDSYGYGFDKWNIDHRIPLASASDIEDLYKLSHYTNLQPMWQPENMIKSDKY